jgi:uncharacterized protein YlzI (FlbEa/FlbD family)
MEWEKCTGSLFNITHLVLLHLIVLHGLDGHEIDINPNEITVMRGKEQGKHLTPTAECAISMVDGKFVAVRETCDEVRQKIEALEKPK